MFGPGPRRPPQKKEVLLTPGIIFQPAAYRGMQKGINQIVQAIRPTLGPRPRVVAVERMPNDKAPELLDDGGTIARRIIQISNRDADVGAMYVRHLLWQLHEKVGDGTATAAVLFQSIYNQGVHYVTSGGNAMQLRRHLERAVPVILDEMSKMTIPVEGKEQLAGIAEAVCHDPTLAKILGEIFDIIGEYGRLEIRSSRGREVEREYVEGMYWETGIYSREMITDYKLFRAQLENAAILISDLDIETPQQLLPVIRTAMQDEIKALMIVTASLSDTAMSLLLANRNPEKFQVIAVKTPGSTLADQMAALQDLAVLTGGRAFTKSAGQSFDGITPEDLGQARRAWADRSNFGIVGGRGDPRGLRQHIANLRSAFKMAEDRDERKKLQQRIGKLIGGSATLRIGAVTETEIETRKTLAERTAETLRGALMEGVLPGGGVALLNCRPALKRMLDACDAPDERAAFRILMRAMEEPTRTIIANAGFDASEVMAEVRLAGPGHGFDATSEQVVDVVQSGIMDVAAVQKSAVHSAIAGAALALTTDVLVHHKKPPEALQTY
jgi:chaperonin GroEL